MGMIIRSASPRVKMQAMRQKKVMAHPICRLQLVLFDPHFGQLNFPMVTTQAGKRIILDSGFCLVSFAKLFLRIQVDLNGDIFCIIA